MAVRAPRHCIENHPTSQSIRFGGVYINLTAISRRDPALTHSYLSRVFNGGRRPSYRLAQRIAKALGMSTDDMMDTMVVRLNAIGQNTPKKSRSKLSRAS